MLKNWKGEKIALAISGGSTKISFMSAVVLALFGAGIEPVVYVGTSSGSIISFLCAIGRKDLLIKYMPIYTLKLIFGVDISKKWQQIKGIVSLPLKGHMFKYKGLERILRTEITEEEFKEYQNTAFMPDCFIHVADDGDLIEAHIDIKTVSLNDAISAVIASCSIPVFVPRQMVLGRPWFDGGVMKHIASEWLVLNHSEKFDKLISVYSRTNKFSDYKGPRNKNPLKLVERILLIKNVLNSFDNKQDTDIACKKIGIEHKAFFAPEILQESTFEAKPEDNLVMMAKGEKLVIESLENVI